MSKEEQLTELYNDFNTRDVDSVLAHFSKDIDWPNGMNGGRVIGITAVREYWINQWTLISTTVEPVSFTHSGVNVNVEVHQIVQNLEGETLSNDIVFHKYFFEDTTIVRMDITTSRDA